MSKANPHAKHDTEAHSGASEKSMDSPANDEGKDELTDSSQDNASATHSLPREQFIPISRGELFDSLPQIESCSAKDKSRLRELFRILDALLNHQYHSQFSELRRVYASLDPDNVFVFGKEAPQDNKKSSDQVFKRLEDILDRANYRRLQRSDLEEAVENAGVLGIRLRVDFDLFDDLHIYARGSRTEVWKKRTWWKLFREEEFDVDVYQRLVIAFRLRDDNRLGEDHSPNVVYIKSFKSIPHSDMHALLPGTSVRMTMVDRGKIILPTLSGLAINLYKMFRLIMVVSIFATALNFFGFIGLVIGVGAYVAKGIFTYMQTKDKYLLNLTRHLYFQNLDNNSGVLLRILNEAEAQDYREMVIAYHVLWMFGKDGLTSKEIDEIAELNILRKTDLEIDFEVDDALRKLEALQIVYAKGDHWFCVTIEKALANLDFRWDSVFSYHWPKREFDKDNP
ncbi:TMEM143 family protein [bacterium]|nr:TMEM143 family protein [bacterium]